MVVLVPFNRAIIMALVQLGIWNDYSKITFPYEIVEGALMSPGQDNPANQVTRSLGWFREAYLLLPDQQNPVS